MSVETKVTEANRTQVPAGIRSRHNVRPGDLVVWDEMPDGTVKVRFRRKPTLRDMVGLTRGAARGNSVEAKRRAQRRG